MATRRTIGNMIAPPRFLAFMATLVVGTPVAANLLHAWTLGLMAAFDTATALFLLLCLPLLRIDDAAVIRAHAKENDANRTVLLFVTAIVLVVLLVAITAEAGGRHAQAYVKPLIIGTLVLAWLFANSVYALHYAHVAYMQPEGSCAGFRFPETPDPVYWDFVYFAFTCGMAFATSDVIVTQANIRKLVTFHCLAAFAFNIGVIAFTINLLASGHG